MLDIIDSQIHLFHTMDAETCIAVMDALGIQGVLIDESWGRKPGSPPAPAIQLRDGSFRPIAPGGQAASLKYPERFRYLLRVNHRDPDALSVMRHAAEDPHCAAFRAMCWEEDLEDLEAGLYRPVLQTAAELGLPLFFQTLGHSSRLRPFVEEVPECKLVIDHVGLVKTRKGWEDVLQMSEYPNVGLKWCHAGLAFPSDTYPFMPMQEALREAVSAFGQERVFWASDASMLRPKISWAETLFYVRECELLTGEERSWVLGRAARALLNWPRA